MRCLPKLALYTFLGLTATTALSRQTLAGPTSAAQKSVTESHEQCIQAHDNAYRLYSISQLMIEARQNKASTERILASDPSLAAKYKSYEKTLADGMALYRQMGGTAETLDDIKPLENPCPSPAPDVAHEFPTSTQPGISPHMHKPHKPAAHSVMSKRSRKNSDARACAELASDKAVMACAEKFR